MCKFQSELPLKGETSEGINLGDVDLMVGGEEPKNMQIVDSKRVECTDSASGAVSLSLLIFAALAAHL